VSSLAIFVIGEYLLYLFPSERSVTCVGERDSPTPSTIHNHHPVPRVPSVSLVAVHRLPLTTRSTNRFRFGPRSDGNTDSPSVESLSSSSRFLRIPRRTKNTICGRHPIGVLLGALSELEKGGRSAEIKWVRYEQSSKCFNIRDSSVSYASAYVKF
jgi:hypothetical protein